MEAGLETKTCKMCCMAIPKDARKCPYCHHFQSRASMVLYHPGFAVLFAIGPMAVLLIMFSMLQDRGEDFEAYRDQISVAESQLAFGEIKSGPSVAVLGTIKNQSRIPWKDIRFQVDFFDANGKRIDVGHKEQYTYYLPAGESLSFKLSFPCEFPQTNYVKHAVRVITAKDGRIRW